MTNEKRQDRDCLETLRLKAKRERAKLEKSLYEKRKFNPVVLDDILESTVGKFLLLEFNIDETSLSNEQLYQLKKDTLYMSVDTRKDLRDEAKRDKLAAEKIHTSLCKLEKLTEELSPSFWMNKGKGIKHHPAIYLHELKYKIQQHSCFVEKELKILGSKKVNITAVALCRRAMDIFFRWRPTNRPFESLGVSYPENWRDHLIISKKDEPGNIDDTNYSIASSELAIFLQSCTVQLSHDNTIWDFDYYDPGLMAKASFLPDYPSYQLLDDRQTEEL